MENTSLVVNNFYPNVYPRVRDTDGKIYQRKRVGTIKLYLLIYAFQDVNVLRYRS